MLVSCINLIPVFAAAAVVVFVPLLFMADDYKLSFDREANSVLIMFRNPPKRKRKRKIVKWMDIKFFALKLPPSSGLLL